MATKIFISYRREPGSLYAMLLHDRLKKIGYEVFIDKESLKLGRFDKQILNQIETCNYFILILTPNALDQRNYQAEDWMHLEIEQALNCGKKIIPIMDKKFRFPANLPLSLSMIPNYQGIETEMTDTNQLPFVLDKLTEFCTPKPQQAKKILGIGFLALCLVGSAGILAFMNNQVTKPVNPGQEISSQNNSDGENAVANPENPQGTNEQIPATADKSGGEIIVVPPIAVDPPPVTQEEPGNNAKEDIPATEPKKGGEIIVNPPVVEPPVTAEPITQNNSTIRESGKKITGNNNTIYGNKNEIYGNNNNIYGDDNNIYGNNNEVNGNNNSIGGNNNEAVGYGNKIIFGNNNDV